MCCFRQLIVLFWSYCRDWDRLKLCKFHHLSTYSNRLSTAPFFLQNPSSISLYTVPMYPQCPINLHYSSVVCTESSYYSFYSTHASVVLINLLCPFVYVICLSKVFICLQIPFYSITINAQYPSAWRVYLSALYRSLVSVCLLFAIYSIRPMNAAVL